MSVYYNEIDPYAAQWLRNLIEAGHIAPGYVDERSIVDVQPGDLTGYRQCHFFAGIGGWSLALRLAGWPDDKPVWTGSPPCQPFSNAGQRRGYDDDRHLAPKWLDLIRQCRPSAVYGEQVAAAASGKQWAWLDDLQDALEAQDYATGAVVLPACGVGAPHIRQRLWFVARRVAHASGPGPSKQRRGPVESARPSETSPVGGLAHNQSERLNRREDSAGQTGRDGVEVGGSAGWAGPPQTEWNDPDWLFCRDGKWRPVESGTFPLADGIPGRVGRLRAYGNAIVPQEAAEIIKATTG